MSLGVEHIPHSHEQGPFLPFLEGEGKSPLRVGDVRWEGCSSPMMQLRIADPLTGMELVLYEALDSAFHILTGRQLLGLVSWW